MPNYRENMTENQIPGPQQASISNNGMPKPTLIDG